MDALKRLTEQHEEVDELIEEIENAEETEEKQALFQEMADKLSAHAAIEEKLFYPAVKEKKTEEILLESAEEHLSIKRVLADMLAMDVDDEHFDAKLSVLKEQVEHHAHEEEEKELFPQVRKLLAKSELENLGEEMSSLFDELMEEHPSENVPNETERAASID